MANRLGGSVSASLRKFDVRKYGMQPYNAADSSATTTAKQAQNRLALQNAIDAAATDAAAAGTGRLNVKQLVYIPPEPNGYRIDKPVFLYGGVDLIGEPGTDSISCLSTVGAYPAVLLMTKHTNFDSTHFVDAFGILDTSAAPGAGSLWAVNLNADSYCSFRASSADLGPVKGGGNKNPSFYRTMTALTIEFKVKRSGASWPTGEFFGTVDIDGNQSPFTVNYSAGGRYDLNFTDNSGNYNNVFCAVSNTATYHHVIFVLDFTAATAQCYAGSDAAPVAVTTNTNFGPTWASGVRLAEPVTGEFALANIYGQGVAKGLIFAGLTLRSAARYGIGVSNGTAPVRTDGKTFNDLNSFCTAWTGDYFQMTLPTSQTGNDGLVKWSSDGGAYGYGVMRLQSYFPSGYIPTCRISGIRFEQFSNMNYGSTLLLGLALDPVIDHCKFFSGGRAIDQQPVNICYTIQLDSVDFYSQGDTSISLDTSLLNATDLFFQSDNRCSMRFKQCNFDINRVFCANTQAEGFAEFRKVGANSRLAWSGTDLESFQPDHGIIISRDGGTGGITHLTMEDVSVSGVSNGNYPIKVESTNNGLLDFPAILTFRNSNNRFVNANWAAIVGMDGAEWLLHVDGPHATIGGSGQVPYAADLYSSARIPRVLSTGGASYPDPTVCADLGLDFTTITGFKGRWRPAGHGFSDLAAVTSLPGDTGTAAAYTPLAKAGTGSIVYHAADSRGYPYLQFDGATYFQAPGGASGSSSNFCVIGIVAGTPVGIYQAAPVGSGMTIQNGCFVNGGVQSRTLSLPTTTTEPFIFAFRGTSQVLEKWVGIRPRPGKAKFAATAQLRQFTLGLGGSSIFFAGKLYDFAVIDGSPSDTDLKNMMQQMCHDSGLHG